MRTTITLADDVAAAVQHHRLNSSIGLSQAVNDLIRKGLVAASRGERFDQVTHDLGDGIDVTNVAEAIETLDGPAAR
ncbi:MAG: CopG family transcriptional regulator [Actinomycetota bacterium]|nr:CopG family transcriptional regulator [Actinomycetota bacterium]